MIEIWVWCIRLLLLRPFVSSCVLDYGFADRKNILRVLTTNSVKVLSFEFCLVHSTIGCRLVCESNFRSLPNKQFVCKHYYVEHVLNWTSDPFRKVPTCTRISLISWEFKVGWRQMKYPRHKFLKVFETVANHCFFNVKQIIFFDLHFYSTFLYHIWARAVSEIVMISKDSKPWLYNMPTLHQTLLKFSVVPKN